MATIETGNWLNKYVAPQLLQEFKNYKDDFIAVLPGVPKKAITADGIRLNKLINNVDFLVNNTSGFTPKKMNGEKIFIEWEKYDTTPTEVDDSEIRGLAFDKRDAVRVKHSEAIKMGIRDHVVWKLAPNDDTNANMPVVRTTGEDDGTGRKRMTFKDIVTLLERVKKLNLPKMDKLYMVLSPEHSSDLVLDKDSAKLFADKKIFFNSDTGRVRAKGAVLTSTDRVASMFFYAPNTYYHLEKVKVLYKPETTDTRSADPASEFRLQVYGIVDRIEDYGVGAIVSGIVK